VNSFVIRFYQPNLSTTKDTKVIQCEYMGVLISKTLMSLQAEGEG
jgi:hypothetical protein